MIARDDRKVTLGERILLALSRDPAQPDYSITTTEYTLENALDFAFKTIPNFSSLIRGRSVLDYGCGPGWQGVAMQKYCNTRSVFCLDIKQDWLDHGESLAEREGFREVLTFANSVPAELMGTFDVVLSLNSFEHFDDPAAHLQRMSSFAAPGGTVVISFAEPWYSHSGSHMNFFTKVPWVNVIFSEETVLRVRSRFRSDGATRYSEIESGLNGMTLRRFEAIMRASGLEIEFLKYHTTKGLPFVHKLPVVREFFVSCATCILRKVG